jgi:hypothetical protein
MRRILIAAVSAAAVLSAAPALAAIQTEYSDAQLEAFASAMVQVRAAAPTDGSAPTPEQQAAMAGAVEASGLTPEEFNALAVRVSSDAVLQARLALLDTPEPAPGSVAAGVTQAEVDQFSAAMVNVRAAAPTDGSTPTPEQAQGMAAAVTASGLSTDRFNEIATAVSQDAHLRARLRLADAQRGG